MLIYGYKFASESSKVLSKALGAKRIKHNSTTFIGRARKTVINWGCSELPDEVMKCQILNHPDAVRLAANKLHTFNALEAAGVSIPPFTTHRDKTANWTTIVERHVLNGNSGEGIVICEEGDELGDAPLYTKYIPKKNEYRIHVFNGEVIDTQRKARVKDVADEDVNWKIRNMDNGFIFARNEDHNIPYGVCLEAHKAVLGLGLHFGAVDVIYNEKEHKAYVLEVNTAPGLSGTTLEKYVEAFNE